MEPVLIGRIRVLRGSSEGGRDGGEEVEAYHIAVK